MDKFVYSTENKTSIIDLYQTADLLKTACEFLYDLAKNGKQIIIVGTKRQASGMVKKYAQESGAMFVNVRWLGGTFTNFSSVKKSRDELKNLKEGRDKGTFNKYTKKERLLINRKVEKLEELVGGIASLDSNPSAIVVIDPKREKTAVHEANIVNVPVVGLIDTNCNPDDINYPVSGNDDALKSIELFLSAVCSVIGQGYKEFESAKAKSAEVKKEDIKVPAVHELKPVQEESPKTAEKKKETAKAKENPEKKPAKALKKEKKEASKAEKKAGKTPKKAKSRKKKSS